MALLVFLALPSSAQNSTPKTPPPSNSLIQELNKYPGLSDEFLRLYQKLSTSVQLPPPRAESRLLPFLPQSSIAYAALSNYGDATAQALKIFRQELQDSAVLHDWWTHSQLATDGPKLLDSLDKLVQLHKFLGDEIVFCAAQDGREPNLFLITDARKPGLKLFLQQTAAQLTGKPKSAIHVFEPDELVATNDAQTKVSSQDLFVLVRPDFVVASSNLATLRNVNARLDAQNHDFPATPFGQRVANEYHGGVSALAAVDLHKILNQVPSATRQSPVFQHSGFADTQYLVWDHKTIDGKSVSQTEVSFTGPRHGAASWLAKPASFGSLEFVSPKAMAGATVVLSNPAQIFDEIKEVATLSNSKAFDAIPAFEQMLKLSLKDDLLSLLTGEITLELDSVNPPQPAWRAILGVKDPNHLQQTLNSLLSLTHFEASSAEDAGVTYHSLHIPTSTTTLDIAYAFVDGHLVIGSGRDSVAEAVQLHRSGESFAKSERLLASVPPNHSLQASALLYEDPATMAALQMRAFLPEHVSALTQSSGTTAPLAMWVYGDDSAIREVSTNPAFDAAGVLIVAAIAIPNLLRSRMAANESTAAGSVHTVVAAQVGYSVAFPNRNYAPDLATLGPSPDDPDASSLEHYSWLNASLGNPTCTGDAWCINSGYRFRINAVCKLKKCNDFVVVATPVSKDTGTRNFCATSDGLIRFKVGAPLTAPLTISQCKAWPPL